MSEIPKEHIIPKIEEWPISKFGTERADFILKLTKYSYSKLVHNHNSTIQELLSKTIYLEKIRSKSNRWKVDPPDEAQYWSGLNLEFQEAINSEQQEIELKKILKRIINRYSEEIVGGFNPKTFRFTRGMTTKFFKAIINKAFEKNQRLFWGKKSDLLKRFKVYGNLENIRALFDKGTVVIVPNHISNIDSLVIGYIIDQIVKIPAFHYGAGLNLYDVEILAYYLNRLGTYRVDRRKKNPIYLTVLKSMASLSLVEGVNNIFFPGGTRSRSGMIENKLKLGLLNSVIEAQQYNIESGFNKKLIIVPMVMSYPFVLEAKPLINQYLRKIGAEKYRSSKSSVGKFSYFLHLVRTIFSRKSEIHVSFGQPRDILGNLIDSEGNSIGDKGASIDINDYFTSVEGLNKDEQRESIYTRILADKIINDYKRLCPILCTDVVAYTCFKLFQKTEGAKDIFGLLNMPAKNIGIAKDIVVENISESMNVLRHMHNEGKINLSYFLRDAHLDANEILKEALSMIGIYHTKDVIYIKNGLVKSEDLKLLYYYHNKLAGYDLKLNK